MDDKKLFDLFWLARSAWLSSVSLKEHYKIGKKPISSKNTDFHKTYTVPWNISVRNVIIDEK